MVDAVTPMDLADPSTLIVDLANPKPKLILALGEMFGYAIKKNPSLGALPVTTGWNDIDPAKAVALLLRNRPGANRQISPTTIIYYAKQMAAGAWKKTGQAILIDSDGVLIDGQHRLYAAVVSGSTINSFVVTEVPAQVALFAYIDNSKARSSADALQTAGFNGVSPTIAKVIKFAHELELGCYNPAGPSRPSRMTPAELLGVVDKYPHVQAASRAATFDYKPMVDLVGSSKKYVIATFTMLVADLYGEETGFYEVENFFDDVTNVDLSEADKHEPAAALKKKLESSLNAKKATLEPHEVMAALIKAFNAWKKGATIKTFVVLDAGQKMPKLANLVEAENGDDDEQEAA